MATMKDKIILNKIRMERTKKIKKISRLIIEKISKIFKNQLFLRIMYKNSFNKSIEANHKIMLLVKKI